jgi:hypothetical protein
MHVKEIKTFSGGRSIELKNQDRDKLLIQETFAVQKDGYKAYFKTAQNYLRSLYESRIEPYFGKAEDKKDCALKEQFGKPVVEGNELSSITYGLYSNANYALGACGHSPDGFQVKLTLAYCKKSQKFLQVKYFYTKENPKWSNPEVLCEL